MNHYSSYDKMSSYYDFLSESSELKFKLKGLALLAPLEGEHILELGCGTGSLLLKIAEPLKNSGEIIGLDLSQGMLDQCRKKIYLQKKSFSNIRLIQADARDMSLSGKSLDAIFCSFTLELFSSEDILLVLAQCQKILKSSGRMVVVSLSSIGKKGLLYSLYQWSHRHFPKWVDCHPINVKSVLVKSGFRVEKSLCLSMWGLPVEIVLVRKT